MLTQNQYQALRNEIDNDPAQLGYAGKLKHELVELLNLPLSFSPSVFVSSNTVPDEVSFLLIERNKWLSLLSFADKGNDRKRNSAANFLEVLKLDSTVNWASSLFDRIYGDLIDAKLLDHTDIAAIKSLTLTEKRQSRGQSLGISVVELDDVEVALSL